MNKKDMALLAILIGLVLTWPMVGPVLEKSLFPKAPVDPLVEQAEPTPAPATEPGEGPTETPPPVTLTETPAPAPDVMPPEPATTAAPETTVVVSNGVIEVTLSSHGGAVKSAVMDEFRESLEPDSAFVELDFSDRHALSYADLPGFGQDASFSLEAGEEGQSATLRRTSASGLTLVREIALDDSYLLKITDSFTNDSGQPIALPEHALRLGMMKGEKGKQKRGVYYLGVDALLLGGKGVEYYGKKIMPRALKESPEPTVEGSIREPADWVAAKNRFFAQILTPADGAEDVRWHAESLMVKGRKQMSSVSASAVQPAVVVPPDEPVVRESTLYLGPKNYSEINQYGRHQWRIMDFGMFAPICKFLLWILNFIHDNLWPHNYGLAIILLTVIIRILFWPITHKGTESMRRMQDIQPLMKEIQAKHKDDPQKQQKAMMALYKEHKVNPVGGCLPMLIQIPVFFALFVVLRSATELRFAPFLWVADLSEPENLFADVLPIGLNILPLIMTAATVLQQKLTPTTADPKQAKMMQYMPIMMLFLFYNFAAGLVLYWTTNNVLMILQQVLYKRRKAKKEAAAG